MVDGLTTIFVRQQFFDFPVIGLGADAKLEILLGDGIPILKQIVSQSLAGMRTSFGVYTLYTIMTASRLQIVATNNPSM